jgi:uncharacterized membrane protein
MHRKIGMAAASFAAAMLLAGPWTEAAEVTDTQIMAIMQKHCVMCHAKKPSHPSFDVPPKDVSLETIEEVKAWAVKIVEQVVLDRNMPVGTDSEMTEEERLALAQWAAALR